MTRPESAPAPEEVYDLLYRLGLTAASAAFFQTITLSARMFRSTVWESVR